MGLLNYSIRRGISRAVGTVVEDKILEVVAPKAKENIAKNQTELTVAAAGLANVANQATMQTAVVCSACGITLPEGVKFCPGCGTPTAPAKAMCPNCGKENAHGIKFCGECGTKLS